MGQRQQMHGLRQQQEVDPQRTQRDIRTPAEMVGAALAEHPAISQVICVVLLPVAYLQPTLFVVVCLPVMFMVTSYPLNESMTLPLVLPVEAKMRDENDPKPGRVFDYMARGRVFLGNARFMRKAFELWQGFAHVLQHTMLLGTTGAGKTETLVSIAANYLAAGSGFMYSDAKAAPKLGWQIYTLARFFGREDDFRALNYIKGNTSERRDPAERQSNTVNLFAYGSDESITQIIVSIMPPGGQENKLFSERAIGLISAVMPALVNLRDNVGLLITPDVIRRSLELEEVEKLKKHPDISRQARESIRSYLASLPGYKEDPGMDPRTKKPKGQPEEVGKQFGFAQAYFTRALSSLSDTYADIYMVGHGEINFLDMVLRRRIGVVMIPALEKAPEEQKNLAKIVLAAQKNAVSTGIPPGIEGRKQDVLESLSTSAPTPYGIINDEFAFMMVEGYGTLMAQARSLYVAFVIAGQDYAGMKRENEAEAEQIAENTKSKIIMASEGLGATAELVKQVAGEGLVATTQGMSRENASLGSYHDGQNVSFERRSRIDTMDTRGQIEGEAIMLWRDKIIPFNSFFHGLDDENITDNFRINRMPDVQTPTRGAAYNRRHNKLPEEAAIRSAVRYGVDFSAKDLVVEELDFLHQALNQRRRALKDGASVAKADGTLYGSIAHQLDSYLSGAEPEPMGADVGEVAQALQSDSIAQDDVGHDRSGTGSGSGVGGGAIHTGEASAIGGEAAQQRAPADEQPPYEDELPEAPAADNGGKALTGQPLSDVETASSSESPSDPVDSVASGLVDTGAYRVLQSAPWVTDPQLLDDVAGRDLAEQERETVQRAADAVARIETAAGVDEDQAQAVGVTTADTVARNIRYPSNHNATMPEPSSEDDRQRVVERTSRIFNDWLNAADDGGEAPEQE